MLSDRMNRRIVSAVPSLIHRVATAAEIGDAMSAERAHCAVERPRGWASGATT
jgi:hypothetical protein